MKKTVTMETAAKAYAVLGPGKAKVTRMEQQEKIAVVAAARALKAHAAALADFEEEAREKMKPEGFGEAVEKGRRFDSLPDAEKAEVNRVFAEYSEAMEACMRGERSRVVEAGFDTLPAEAFDRLVESNDFDIDTIMTLQDALCG